MAADDQQLRPSQATHHPNHSRLECHPSSPPPICIWPRSSSSPPTSRIHPPTRQQPSSVTIAHEPTVPASDPSSDPSNDPTRLACITPMSSHPSPASC
ncbi:hypothetical protein ACLOJK_028312 [Asimina triloba]